MWYMYLLRRKTHKFNVVVTGCNRFHNLLFLKQHFYILFRADDE